MQATIELEDGSLYHGQAFGHPQSVSGEFVFNTGMTGYTETLTDPSYKGEILVLTYPLIGNYGIPRIRSEAELAQAAESPRAQIAGLVVADYSEEYSHWDAALSLGDWLSEERVPAVTGVDTRALTKRLRERGTMLGRLNVDGRPVELYDPNKDELVPKVSLTEPVTYGSGKKRVVLVDCGVKANIVRSLVSRGVTVVRVPWDYDPLKENPDGIVVSNGPGDPKMCKATIANLRQAMARRVPIFGICLGHQLLALAAGADTFKMKYGHRSQNQPCLQVGTRRCFITSQNHGFAVDDKTLPRDWDPWFFNANDSTNEGMRHRTLPFMSVQFHPEACPGPTDTAFLFDEFIRML